WASARATRGAAPSGGAVVAAPKPHAPVVTPNYHDLLPSDRGGLPSAPVQELPESGAGVRNAPPAVVPHQIPDPPQPIPPPRPKEPALFGGRPLLDLPPFDLVQVRVPLLISVSDLDRADARQKLADELAKDPAFRIDVFVKDTVRGAELVRAALRA